VVATRKWTVEEVQAGPPAGDWELIEGELVRMSPSAGRSGVVGGRIAVLVGAHVLAGGIGQPIIPEAGYRPDPNRDTVRSPDFSVIRNERMPSPEQQRGFLPLAPDFVVEVLSPTGRWADALSKCAWWLEVGVRLLWLVDPETESVVVMTQDRAPDRLAAGALLDGGDVLPDLAIPVADIFA